jgi:hypothetical protein
MFTRVFVTAAASLALLVAAAATPATDVALADRCQPEEIVTGPGTSPIPESSDPRCPIMDAYVYPRLACRDKTKFMNCVNTLDELETVDRSTPFAYDPAYCGRYGVDYKGESNPYYLVGPLCGP